MNERTELILIASIVIIIVMIGGVWYANLALYAHSETKEEYIQNINLNTNISPSENWKLIDKENKTYSSNYGNIHVIWKAYIDHSERYDGNEIVVVFNTNISANDYLVGYGDSKPTFTITIKTTGNVSSFAENDFGFQYVKTIGPLTYGSRTYTPNIISNWGYSNAYIKEVHNASISAMVSPPPEKSENITLLYVFTAYIENNGVIHTVNFSFPAVIHHN